MAVCNGTPFTVKKISPRAGLELETVGSLIKVVVVLLLFYIHGHLGTA